MPETQTDDKLDNDFISEEDEVIDENIIREIAPFIYMIRDAFLDDKSVKQMKCELLIDESLQERAVRITMEVAR